MQEEQEDDKRKGNQSTQQVEKRIQDPMPASFAIPVNNHSRLRQSKRHEHAHCIKRNQQVCLSMKNEDQDNRTDSKRNNPV